MVTLLGSLTLAALWPVLRNDFVAYDDTSYVTENPAVREGLTWSGLVWAFTTGHAANWHPLTWLSHMVDVALFRLNPSGHHAMSLGLHLLNTFLLWLVLEKFTGERWRSAVVAGLFAAHPAHVESVAWVAERKDVLSTTFWLATMGAYGEWTRRRGIRRYLLVCLALAAGLMSKPMLVSLPVILLLLDYWPLDRMRGDPDEAGIGWQPRVIEKLPLFSIAAVSAAVTFLVQRAGGAVGSLDQYPLTARAANAILAYVRYLRMLVWPADLAVFYPHPGRSLPVIETAAAALLLLGISGGAVLLRRRAPYLLVGWLWFVVTLFPVIGIVQVGWQGMADRYTYVPYIGLFIALTWGIASCWPRASAARTALRLATGAALISLAVTSMRQAGYWKNTETLFLRAIRVTTDNYVAESNLGDYYNNRGEPSRAIPHLTAAIRTHPTYVEAQTNLGRSFFLLDRLDEAEQRFAEAVRLKPDSAVALNDLAWIRWLKGDLPAAIDLYRRSVAADPESAYVRHKMAIVLLAHGQRAEALRQLEHARRTAPEAEEIRELFRLVIASDPHRPGASTELNRYIAAMHRSAALLLMECGKNAEAGFHLARAIERSPESMENHNDLGTLLAREGRLEDARREFERALAIDPRSALAHNNLGRAYFAEGRTDLAIAEYREALRLQPDLQLARTNLELALSNPGPRTIREHDRR